MKRVEFWRWVDPRCDHRSHAKDPSPDARGGCARAASSARRIFGCIMFHDRFTRYSYAGTIQGWPLLARSNAGGSIVGRVDIRPAWRPSRISSPNPWTNSAPWRFSTRSSTAQNDADGPRRWQDCSGGWIRLSPLPRRTLCSRRSTPCRPDAYVQLPHLVRRMIQGPGISETLSCRCSCK
jgi:hypothetical protein